MLVVKDFLFYVFFLDDFVFLVYMEIDGEEKNDGVIYKGNVSIKVLLSEVIGLYVLELCVYSIVVKFVYRGKGFFFVFCVL